MAASSLESLTQQLELADQLLAGRDAMQEPHDLPGRYSRVVKAVERVLQVTNIAGVVAGGGAVWRYGYVARVTQDVDIALPADRIDEFHQVAAVSGFDLLPTRPVRWPKMFHRETQVQVDILPEGARPGAADRLAPTTIPHPAELGAKPGILLYIELPSLIVLNLATGHTKDDGDVEELLRVNADQIEAIRARVASARPDYEVKFTELERRAAADQTR